MGGGGGGGGFGQTQAQMYAAQQQMQQQYPGAPTVSTQVGTANRMTYQQAIHLITIRLGLVEQQLLDARNRPSMLDPSENDHLAMIEKSVLDAMQSRIDSVDAQLKTLASAPPAAAAHVANGGGVGAALSKQQLETLQRQLAVVQQAVTQQKTTLAQLTDENSKLRAQVATLVADVEPIKEWILNMNSSSDMMMGMGMPDMGDGSGMMMDMENGQFDIDFGNEANGFMTDAAQHSGAGATEASIVVEEM